MAFGGDAGEAVVADDAFVDFEPEALDQRHRALAVADRLAMRVGVHQPAERGAVVRQFGDGIGHQHHRHRVEQHRGRTRELAVGLERATLERELADLGRDQEQAAAELFDLGPDALDLGEVGAGVVEQRHLAPGQRGIALLDDRQRVGKVEVERFDRRRAGGGERHGEAIGDALRERWVDVDEVGKDARADRFDRDLAQFKHQSRGDMRLFDVGLRAVEHPRLAEVIGEAFGADAKLLRGVVALVVDRRGDEAAAAFARAAILADFAERIGLVIGAALGDEGLHLAVAGEVAERAARLVDRDLVEIGGAKAAVLRVEVGEQAALKQRVVGEIDPRRDVGGEEGDLLGLGEEIVDVAVEREAADDPGREHFLGDQLGRVEHVVGQACREFLVEALDREFPHREVAVVDRLEQVAAVEIGVGAGDLDGLVPAGRLQPEHGLPQEFDEARLARLIDQAEGVDSEALHRAERARQGAVAHRPHDHVG